MFSETSVVINLCTTSIYNITIFFSAKHSGSFVKLSAAIQRSAVELLFHLPSLNDQLLQNVVSCCHGDQLGVSVIQYILQVLYYRFAHHGLGGELPYKREGDACCVTWGCKL